jgi:Family of unknown function (DUF6804)
MNSRPHVVPALASAGLLVVALGEHPYGYYTFLRWVVCLSAGVVCWVAWHSTAQWATWLFAGVAFLFNPIVPVFLERSTWQPIDVICAIAFLASTALERQSQLAPAGHAAPDADPPD